MISDNRDELPASAYLWHDRSLYIGAIQSPCQLCTHAPALVVCVDHPASVWCEGQWRQTDSFLVGANQQLELITRGGKVAAMFLDPLGREYRQLIPRTGLSGKSIHCDLIDYPLLRDRFLQIQSNKTSAA
ncbi:MAG: hypothetical protein R3208_07155, partial [Ketobacteraceae bacterium]|nr:hypothetical protein [Ketobacteraceae bacterium]